MRFNGLPTWAVLGGAGAVIFAVLSLYTIRWRLPQRIVATTALWQRVTVARRGAGRLGAFEHLISMLLQLFIGLVLVLAAGMPRFSCQSAAGRQVVIVLDRSASMGAAERVETRLESARRRALSLVQNAAVTDEVSLVLAGGAPEVAVPLGNDAIGLRRAISLAQLRPGAGRVAEAVGIACGIIATGSQGRIIVITDGSEPIGRCATAALEPLLIGDPRPNVGITAFGSGISPFDPLHASAFVEVMNSWHHDADAELRVSLDGKLVEVAPLKIKSGQVVQRVFEGLSLAGDGHLEAHLAKIDFTEGGDDALHEDDRAFTVISHRALVSIDLIGTSEPLHLVLAANPRYRVTARKSLAEAQGAIQVVIGAPGGELSAGRFLLVDPHGDGLPFEVGQAVANPQITSLSEDHPIARRVVLSDVSIDEARRVRLPASASIVVQAPPATPLVFAQVEGAQRIAALSFDPSRSNLPLRVGFPVLIYNMVDWLLGDQAIEREDVRLVRSHAALRVTPPNGKPQVVEPKDDVVLIEPDEVGFYEITAFEGKRVHAFGVSVASRQETDLQPRPHPGKIERPSGTLRDREISSWLWLAVLALLLLEWLTYQRRVTV